MEYNYILPFIGVEHNKLNKIPNNMIRYWSETQLPETTSLKTAGLHTNSFNTNIVSHTFENGIGTIEFESDVTSLNGYCFYNCPITAIELPESIQSIKDYSFLGVSANPFCIYTSNLDKFIYIDWSGNYSALTTSTRIYENEKIVTSLTIKDITVTYRTFNSLLDVKSITLDNVECVELLSFQNCSSLTEVTLNNVELVKEYSFQNCPSLTNLTIKANKAVQINYPAFSNINLETFICDCPGFKINTDAPVFSPLTAKTIILSDKVLTLESLNTQALENLIGGNNITHTMNFHIDSRSPYYASLENGPIYIGKCLIGVKGDDSTINIQEGTVEISYYSLPNTVKSVILPNNLEHLLVGSNFSLIDNIYVNSLELYRNIDIDPSSLNSFYVYIQGEKLTTLEYQETNDKYIKGIEDLVTDTDAPREKSDLRTLVIRDTNKNTFTSCPNLTLVTITGLEFFDRPFSSYLGLDLDDTMLYYLYISDFFGTQVEHYIIGDQVSTLGSNTFYQGCENVKTISFGSGITNIQDIFTSCTGLESVTFNSSNPPSFRNSNLSFHKVLTVPSIIYVPANSVDLYKQTWSDYASKIQAIP